MATWRDVSRVALALPEAEAGVAGHGGHRAWKVRKKLFVWERPLRKSDLKALGEAAPDGPILGAKVEHLIAKDALLADDPDVFFTIPHFDGYPAVLIRLPEISAEILEEVIAEAWLTQAPKRVARQYLDGLSAR